MKIKVVKDAPVKKSSIGQVVKNSISLPSSGGGSSIVSGGNSGGGDVSPPVNYNYALKSMVYDHAQMTTEVTLPADGIISFSFYVVESSSTDYILKSTTGSYIYYRQSDGRFRVVTDDGRIFNFDGFILPLNKVSRVQIIFNDAGVDMYLNNEFYDTRLGSHTTFTVGQIGEDISTFGVTIGNLASYPLLTESVADTNPFDMIGSNNLTFVNLKNPLDEDDYIEVIDND